MSRLEFDSIELYIGERHLLRSIYMVCETGAITALLGRNGCGKTTLLKIVFGAIPLSQKSIRINGRWIGPRYLSSRVIAYLPQADLIPSYLTMRKAFSLSNIDINRVTEFFPGAEDLLDLRPAELSGGYLRIFEILLILHSRALFCLLDEPFTGLTPKYVEKVKELLTTFKSVKGILITDHLHKHVTDIADRLYLLANGRTYHVTDHQQLISLGYVNHL